MKASAEERESSISGASPLHLMLSNLGGPRRYWLPKRGRIFRSVLDTASLVERARLGCWELVTCDLAIDTTHEPRGDRIHDGPYSANWSGVWFLNAPERHWLSRRRM